jgi:hypothetical protein
MGAEDKERKRHMKKNILMFGILLASLGCIQPNISTLPNGTVKMPFNMEEFDKRFDLAGDLALDDMVAWWTTDSIMAEKPNQLDSLDKTWFIYEENEVRFAFYGRYDDKSGQYIPKYSFFADKDGKVKRISNTVEQNAVKYAQAVTTGKSKLKQIMDSLDIDVKYNHYVKKDNDNSFEMWFFLAGAGNYCAYGLDVHMQIDSSRTSVKQYEIVGNGLRYFEFKDKPYKIELDNTFAVMPSVGNLFFMIMNRKYFERIVIVNKESISSMIHSPKTKEWVWIHSVR